MNFEEYTETSLVYELSEQAIERRQTELEWMDLFSQALWLAFPSICDLNKIAGCPMHDGSVFMGVEREAMPCGDWTEEYCLTVLRHRDGRITEKGWCREDLDYGWDPCAGDRSVPALLATCMALANRAGNNVPVVGISNETLLLFLDYIYHEALAVEQGGAE